MRGRRGPSNSARWGFEAVEVEVGGRVTATLPPTTELTTFQLGKMEGRQRHRAGKFDDASSSSNEGERAGDKGGEEELGFRQREDRAEKDLLRLIGEVLESCEWTLMTGRLVSVLSGRTELGARPIGWRHQKWSQVLASNFDMGGRRRWKWKWRLKCSPIVFSTQDDGGLNVKKSPQERVESRGQTSAPNGKKNGSSLLHPSRSMAVPCLEQQHVPPCLLSPWRVVRFKAVSRFAC
ncbi:hypothetical protein B0T18DRAFT_145807 [Schizothecium vesticola]|uniref:Uncharacterized protein n=1 Tax=Schizothecium vesticola TaxID=314040 RepID=A0AA40K515_9PEZI|nr:hypothetical protein B0T18DRAFT_145807 [Schizothecium vesticola]